MARCACDETSRKARVIDEVRDSHRGLEDARERYERALFDARAEGITNTKLASILGITEAGVRMFFKRKSA